MPKYLVETVSVFRMRYVVEAKNASDAKDEVTMSMGDDFKEFKKAKAELNKRLKELNHELNQLLHKQARYGS